ncbi:unnamed protein product [Brugia timori]|uniref:Uncharacterized protein n=1 Tax=Brugia timori TaxID=42155 RepID=A0A3P7UB38_9BILA|nr:unnamed protein product [Brugia timori]
MHIVGNLYLKSFIFQIVFQNFFFLIDICVLVKLIFKLFVIE